MGTLRASVKRFSRACTTLFALSADRSNSQTNFCGKGPLFLERVTYFETLLRENYHLDGIQFPREPKKLVKVGLRNFFSAHCHPPGHVVEWDLLRLRPLTLLDSYGGAVWSLALDAAGVTLAVACEDGQVWFPCWEGNSITFFFWYNTPLHWHFGTVAVVLNGSVNYSIPFCNGFAVVSVLERATWPNIHGTISSVNVVSAKNHFSGTCWTRFT